LLETLAPSSRPASSWLNLGAPTSFPILETLYIPYLYKLTNDPINHNLLWALIPHNIHVVIWRKIRRWPGYTHHYLPRMVCIELHDWQSYSAQTLLHTFTRNDTKWYTELPWSSINTFGSLVMELLNDFYIPIRYETETELLNTLH